MKNHSSNHSGLLLMEIIIAVLFFSVVSAVCLQLFVKSHSYSEDAQALDRAVHQAVSAAELIRSSADPSGVLQSEYPELMADGDSLYLYYDKDFGTIGTKKDAVYYMEMIPDSAGTSLTSYRISIYKAKSTKSIYNLNVSVYQQAVLPERGQ